jgi:GNAT superfamily N-acetyltransferase
MAEIRPFGPDDLHAVAALLQANLPPWTTPEEIPNSLAATYLDDPWRDPELPSLVAFEGGEIIGFVGAQVRRFRFGDRTLRGVCASHLTVDPNRRGGGTGALLLRRLLTGGQDLSFSDSANEEVVRIWQVLGGRLDAARSCDWMVVLRPMRWMLPIAAAALPGRSADSERLPVRALPFGALKPRRAHPAPEPDVTSADASSAEIVELMPEMARKIPLRVEYDEGFLEHLCRNVESQYGRLVRRIVRRGESSLGWYAYVPRPGGSSHVLQCLASGQNAPAVLADLLRDARGRRSAVLAGRLEPHLARPLGDLGPVLGLARQPVLHSHDPEILAALASGDSVLSQLDSEWFVP